MHAGNVFSLVKRTLFEANSKACRFGRESLTSVLTGRLLLASLLPVNPGPPKYYVETEAWQPCEKRM